MPRNPSTTAVMTVSLPAPMARRVDRARKGRTRSEVVREALRHYLGAQEEIEDAGRRAYLAAKAGKGLSPVFEIADDAIAHLRASAVKRRSKRK